MNLFDFMFPEQAEATHLRSISEKLSTNRIREKKMASKNSIVSQEVQDLGDDVGFIALMLMSLMKKMIEKEIITKEEILLTITEMDGLDGVLDGKIDTGILRGSVGIVKEEIPKQKPKQKFSTKKKPLKIKRK